MPFGVCSDCVHYYVMDETPSPRWKCPYCKRSLREVPRHEALTHLRYVWDHPQSAAALAGPTERRSGDTYRMMVVTRRLAQKVKGAAVDGPGVMPPPVIEIRHQDTGQVLWFVAGESLERADLTGAELTRADLHGVNLHKALLSGANLAEANLSGARMDGAVLTGANLSHADMHSAGLAGTVLGSCDLTGARLDRQFLGTPLYDSRTRWPLRFDPQAAGAKLLAADSVASRGS